ncbi:MAG: class I SAM-dependent methyltransferase [Bdellovibrionales bacterium]
MSSARSDAETDRQALVAKWNLEYEQGGIPSSARSSPSGAVNWAVNVMQRHNLPMRTALDIGCGKGRNSLFLARQGVEVTAIDFVPDAIRALEESAKKEGLSGKIRPILYDVTEPWPIQAASMDLVIDAFCFKHITPFPAREHYKRELLRVLRARGRYLISFASVGDGYYGQYVVEKRQIDGEEEHLVIDPGNGIESILFTRKHALNFFEPELCLHLELHDAKPSEMHGDSYPRDTYALLLQRYSSPI